jgi:aquaporin Z
MQRLLTHWPEYLIEAFALGTFMVSAGVFSVLIAHPDSAMAALVGNADASRVLLGLLMGLTAIAIIYSPWGRRSGAHMNPAITLSFLRLGRIARADAAFYVAAQFIGGIAGVLLVEQLFGERFTAPPLHRAATLPGGAGTAAAFAAELLISFGMMLTVLWFSNHPRLERWTGVAAGVLVATYIGIEAPLSGMSMNPARSFASAAPGGLWEHLWIYFSAPVAGMLLAVATWRAGARAVGCAKLVHATDQRCIHCGYDPAPGMTPMSTGVQPGGEG